MSKKFTKRALSLLIALALTISLLPSVVFAADGEVVLDFMNNTNFSIIENSGVTLTVSNTNNTKFKYYRLNSAPSGTAYPWLFKDAMKFTLETDALSAGCYDIELTGGAYTDGSCFYVYVNDKYAGMCSFYTDGTDINAGSEIKKSLKTLNVVPVDGKVQITFAFAGTGASNVSGYYGKAYPKTLTFTPNNSYAEPTVTSVVSDGLEEEMIVGQTANVTAYVNMSDGVFVTNNYNVDKTVSTENFVDVEIIDNPDNAISLTDTEGSAYGAYFKTSDGYGGKYHTHFNGTYNGALEAVSAGVAKIKISAIVDGVDYSTTKTITVTDPNAPIKLEFNDSTLQVAESGGAAAATETEKANFEIVDGQTTNTELYVWDKQIRIAGYMDSADTMNWYANYTNENNRGRFTVKTKLPAGNYKVNYAGGNASPGGIVAIYINGGFVGMDDCYKEGVRYVDNVIEDKTAMGYVTVTSDEEYTEITFLVAAIRNPGKNDMMLSSIEFEKVESVPEKSTEVAVGGKTISSEDEIELSNKEDISLSARLKYADEIYCDLTGHTPDFVNKKLTADPQNAFSVSVKGYSVEYQETRDFASSASMQETMGVYTGKLTAVAPGTSTVTVTATVNGTAKTSTFTVNVPYADENAATIENTISYIVRAEDSANNDKVSVSDTEYTEIGEVGEWTVGKSFTATATGDGFAYWANGNGTPVSASASYTFKPTSNFTLEAVYAPATTAEKKVQFWNYNKVFLHDITATGDTLGAAMPGNPTLNGWSFVKWTTDGSDTFDSTTVINDAITRVVAQFAEVEDAFTVDGEKYNYDEEFSKTAEATNGEKVFSHWTVNGQTASYNKTLSFNVRDSVDVEAVYADAAPAAVPTVVLDKAGDDEYFILYEVPTGYTLVDAGIVFGTSGTTPTVRSTDGSKASAAKLTGQFTAVPGDASHTVARGYVMYEDSYGNLRVLYADAQ